MARGIVSLVTPPAAKVSAAVAGSELRGAGAGRAGAAGCRAAREAAGTAATGLPEKSA